MDGSVVFWDARADGRIRPRRSIREPHPAIRESDPPIRPCIRTLRTRVADWGALVRGAGAGLGQTNLRICESPVDNLREAGTTDFGIPGPGTLGHSVFPDTASSRTQRLPGHIAVNTLPVANAVPAVHAIPVVNDRRIG